MRQIDFLVVHCTATHKTATVESIQRYWKTSLGWKNPGYHKIITDKGEIITLLPDSGIANGVAGYNSKSLHVAYIGGLKCDDRNELQKAALIKVLTDWKKTYPNAKIKGHRDFPGVKKACPQFNATVEYSKI
jgi:N-acetylmuramoyl-L-alanine amidase